MQCRSEIIVLLQSPVGTTDIRQVVKRSGTPADKNGKINILWQTHTHN